MSKTPITIASVLAIGEDTLIKKQHAGGKSSIYKPELLDGLGEKEKRSARTKLRRKLENFLNTYVSIKADKPKVEALRTAWAQYAPMVYKDTKNILESNAGPEKLATAQQFLIDMGTIEATPKADKKKVVIKKSKPIVG